MSNPTGTCAWLDVLPKVPKPETRPYTKTLNETLNKSLDKTRTETLNKWGPGALDLCGPCAPAGPARPGAQPGLDAAAACRRGGPDVRASPVTRFLVKAGECLRH